MKQLQDTMLEKSTLEGGSYNKQQLQYEIHRNVTATRFNEMLK